MKKVLIAGGTGFVGKALIKHLLNGGYTVHVLTRRQNTPSIGNAQYFQWDIEKGSIDEQAFEGVTEIINLTGVSIIEKRWTKKRKAEIIESRTKAIDLLYQYVHALSTPVNTFISSSAVGYYGAVTSNELFTETSENGNDFVASVCKQWEKAALRFESLNIPTVILRKGVVLGKDGGMYQKLAPLAKSSINVSLGDGQQYLPWIDIRDLVRLYAFILQTKKMQGIFNAVSSEHITMNDLSNTLLGSFGKKSFLPNVPTFLIKLRFGKMSAMLLEGSKVSNEKLSEKGFHFEYDTILKAFRW